MKYGIRALAHEQVAGTLKNSAKAGLRAQREASRRPHTDRGERGIRRLLSRPGSCGAAGGRGTGRGSRSRESGQVNLRPVSEACYSLVVSSRACLIHSSARAARVRLPKILRISSGLAFANWV